MSTTLNPAPDDRRPLPDRYDELRYLTQATPFAHPARLAALGRLHGVATAGAGFRLLELGCSDGGHLLPLAATHPGATCIGVDRAREALAVARQRAADCGLANARFVEADLLALPADLGRFDYVVAHGVYAWVPEAVRDALLAAIARHLAPGGVAFVSYATLPGHRLRQVADDVLRFHAADLATAADQAREARALIALLTRDDDPQTRHNAVLRDALRAAGALADPALVHDRLAPALAPVLFADFAAHADAHGLAFLCEAEPPLSSTRTLSPATRAELDALPPLVREQYIDFVHCTAFRQTLLVRSDDAPRPRDASSLDDLWFAPAPGWRALLAAPPASLPDEPGTRALFDALAAAWPLPVRGRVLADVASRDLVVEGLDAGALAPLGWPPAAATAVVERPQASAWVRHMAATGAARVPDAYHALHVLPPGLRAPLLALLDGQRGVDDLVRALRERGVEATTRSVRDELAALARAALLADG